MLIGDAAAAVSPLTAGGLDLCPGLSKFAAETVFERLKTGKPEILLGYSDELFRARFVSRLWRRRITVVASNQTVLEFGFTFLRGRLGQKFAKHIFLGRSSFPDVATKYSQVEKALDD